MPGSSKLSNTWYAIMTGANGIPAWIWFFGCGLIGLATSVAFVYITQYYTAGSFRPVREIAEASKTGPATNIISGTAVGFVLALQMYYALVIYGAAESLGLIVNLSLVRELGPVVAGLLFAGRAGTPGLHPSRS